MTSHRPETGHTLLAAEGGSHAMTSSESVAANVQQVWVRLARRFARLIGDGGIRTVQDRSLRVVAMRRPWMNPPDEGFGEDWGALRVIFGEQDPTEAVAGFEELVAAWTALLGRFIGDALVEQILHEMWPGVFRGDVKGSGPSPDTKEPM